MSGWIGVDLDGTLAQYDKFVSPTHIGPPVRRMLERVQKWLKEGHEVRILTARVSHDNSAKRILEAMDAQYAIRDWCVQHIGRELPITCVKDYGMWQLWDDRAVGVVKNTGERMDGIPDGDATP